MNFKFLLSISLSTIFIICSCSNDDSVVWHPIKDHIPYYYHNHEKINKDRIFENRKSVPDEIVLLHRYLRNEADSTKIQTLENYTLPLYEDQIVSFGNRLIRLDRINERLTEFDLINDSETVLAEFGRGPEDLQMSREIIKSNNGIIIIRGDGFISELNCVKIPCSFDKTIAIKFLPHSIAKRNDTYAILGRPLNPYSGTYSEAEDFKNSVTIFDNNGEKLKTFGGKYDDNGKMLLLNTYMSGGKVHFMQSKDIYIVTFPMFPFLYIYDAETLELIESYKIESFVLRRHKYDKNIGSLSRTFEESSRIVNVKHYNSGFLLLKTENRQYTNHPDYNSDFEYYIIDLESKESFYIGYYESHSNDKRIYVTKYGLLIHYNDEGLAKFIKL